MRLPRTLALSVLLGACAPLIGQQVSTTFAPAPVGSLAVAAENRVENAPYHPQPGDLCICDDFNRFRHAVYRLAGTAAPTHVCMVIADRDGKPAVLDIGGPKLITSKVLIMDVEMRFLTYPGDIQVRRLKQPLTPEQSRELTEFAYAQEGKGFALSRVILQGTPLSARKGLRKTLFAKTDFNRTRWFCSEIVVAAGTRAQIFNPREVFANATYPRDLAFDETINLSTLYHPASMWSPNPARPALEHSASMK